MINILFLIPNLGHGGAEKVLVNLANHMDRNVFQITVMTLYDEGVNKDLLSPYIHYRSWLKKSFPGVGHLLKALSPKQLYGMIVKEHYDILVSYLEGQTARIISGCPDPRSKTIAWIHVEQHSEKNAAVMFRSVNEMRACYQKFDQIVCVSQFVKNDFMSIVPHPNVTVLYNTVESDVIRFKSEEMAENFLFCEGEWKLCSVGTLKPSKGFARLIKIHARLRREGYPVHTYILGEGPDEAKLKKLAASEGCADSVTFLGYQMNPYQYVRRCDLFICSSYAEGFSTAATEALIVGTPVCTVEVSGMKEMLGEHNEYGLVTENKTKALYVGIKTLLDHPKMLEYYRKQAVIRGSEFSTEETVKQVEIFLASLVERGTDD